MKETATRSKHPGGRPPKFTEPSRPVTVTLPESTLQQLAAISTDRAKAIVKATTAALPTDHPQRSLIEVVQVLPGLGIILIGPSRRLKQIAWLRLVEVAPNRFLLALPSETSADSLEVALTDLLESIPPDETRERKLILELQNHLRLFRRKNKVTKAEILLVNTKG